MAEVYVEKIADFADGDRRIVFHDGVEIGVFHWQGAFYAYQNLCLHQGGPCCEGVIMPKVEDVLGPEGADDLAGRGADGAATAAFAAASAPAGSVDARGGGDGQGTIGDEASEDPSSSGISPAAIDDLAVPSDDGLGAALWVFIVAGALGAVAFAFIERGRRLSSR